LDLIREVAAGDDFESGGRADALRFLDDGGWFWGELAVVDFDRAVAEAIEGGAPGVGDGEAGGAVEVVTLGGVAEEAAV